MSVSIVELPDLLISFLKVISAAFIVFEITIGASVNKKPLQNRFIWISLGVAIVTLVWLLNAVLALNAEAIAFLYPYFFGFLFLLGPGVYFALSDLKIANLTYLLVHVSAAVFICFGRWSVASAVPLTPEYVISIIQSSKPLYSIFEQTYLGSDLILYILLPVQFLVYGFLTAFKTKKIAHIVILTLLFGLILLFTFVYTARFDILNAFIQTAAITIEIALFIAVLRILIVKPSLTAAYKKSLAERHTNVEIINYLSDFERAQQDFSSSEFNLNVLITKSNIDLNSWRNYLEDEKVSFTMLKKRIRINYAQRLLAGDFVDQYTVEYLTQTIGYQSRTSFYTAYKEITGKSFTERDAPQKDL
tara:strand:- start:90 stop:1172 length:1083 start_codon:yes stop_codon:yes gene_type:complete